LFALNPSIAFCRMQKAKTKVWSVESKLKSPSKCPFWQISESRNEIFYASLSLHVQELIIASHIKITKMALDCGKTLQRPMP
jgi:hypothetical protein